MHYTQRGIASVWREGPFIPVALGAISGMLLQRVQLLPPLPVLVLALLVALLHARLMVRPAPYAYRWRNGSLVPLFFLCFGMGWQGLHGPELRADDVARSAEQGEAWLVRVHEPASDNGRTVRTWVVVEAVRVEGSVRPASGRMLATLLLDTGRTAPVVGERLVVHGAAEPLLRIPDPGGFDARGWAASQGAAYGCFAPAHRWTTVAPAWGPAAWFQSGRDRVNSWLAASAMHPAEQGMTKAVLLGLRDGLTQERKDAFIRSGTMHVLAVSGGHVVVIYGALLFALKHLGERRRARLVRGIITLVVLWGYAGITGASPSVLRATFTFSLFAIAGMTHWRAAPINSLAAAAFLLVVWDPTVLLQLGFMLSFLAVLGILVFNGPLTRAWAAPNAVLHQVWSLLCVSLSAQAFTLPLSLLVFQAFPVWFLPANLLVVAQVFVAVYLGAAVLALHKLPWLGAGLVALAEWWSLLLYRSAAWFAQLPWAYPAVRVDGWQCLLLYAMVVAMGYVWLRRTIWARWAMGALLLLFAFSWAGQAHQRQHQHGFVVYDDRDALVMGFVQGRALLVFGDSSDARVRAKAERHARHADLRALHYRPVAPGVFHLSDATVRVGSAASGPMDGGAQLLVVDAHSEPPEHGLPAGSQVVVAPGTKGRRAAEWRRYGTRWGVPVHEVRAAGAYVR